MGVVNVEKYKFNSKHSSMIVNAIVKGYREYVEHRKELHNKMAISSAFAWTRNNFIESELAKQCKVTGFSTIHAKAGPTWNYLQFVNDQTKRLFIVRNATYFNPSSSSSLSIPLPRSEGGRATAYLEELAKMNGHIEFPVEKQMHLEENKENELTAASYVPAKQVSTQLDLFKNKYTSFHILTYELDEANQLRKVMHYLPDPLQNIAHLVEDLSSYISGAELSWEERNILEPDHVEEVIGSDSFDLGIFKE